MDRWSQKRAADRRRGRTYLAARRRGHRPWPSLRLVLAGELKRTGGDDRRAFDTYETRLRPFTPADGSCHGGAVAHELAIVAVDGCMASAVADVLQVANGMVLRGGGSPVVSVRVATPSGGDATGFGRRTDSCRPIPSRAGQRGRGGAAAVQRRAGRLAGRAPRSDRMAEKPCRRGCSADVAQTPATNAATKAMVAAAQQTRCPDTWAPAGPPSTP